MSRNNQLELENKRLSQKVEEMKEICTLTSTMNVNFKSQLERESVDKGNLKESNQKLKISLNKLSVKCNELNQRVKVLETNLKRKVMTRINQPRVQIIKSASDVVRSDNQALEDLQKRHDKLDAEHQEALNVIDELEFELGDVMIQNVSLLEAKGSTMICFFLRFMFHRCFRSTTLNRKLNGCSKKTRNSEKCFNNPVIRKSPLHTYSRSLFPTAA